LTGQINHLYRFHFYYLLASKDIHYTKILGISFLRILREV